MIETASAAIIKDKKILLVKRLDSAILFPGCWGLPGGKAEPGETPEETVIREVEEETNLDFYPEELFTTNYFQDRQMHRFTGNWAGDISLQVEELSDYGWFSFDESLELEMAFDYREIVEVLYDKGLIQ